MNAKEFELLREFAEQKLREEFDNSKNWWEQEEIMKKALELVLIDLHNEMKSDLNITVSDQKEMSNEFQASTGYPKF